MSKSHLRPARKTRVIHTSGDDRAMGRAHMEQMDISVSDTMPGFFYRFWKSVFDFKSTNFIERIGFALGKNLIDPLLINKLFNNLPHYVKERVGGMCDVSGASFEELATALVLPDLLPLLQAYATRIGHVRTVEVRMPEGLGCSSYLAQGKKFLQGRNLDFPGVGYWDRYPVIQMFAPKDGLKYLGFTTAAAPVGGITGINEAQISVSLHQHYALETDLKGQLPFVCGEEILKYARTLEEAIEILKNFRFANSWAYVVGDGKTKRGFLFESNPREKKVLWLSEKNPITHSNHFQLLKSSTEEYAMTHRMNWDNYCRKTRLELLVKQAGAELDFEQAVKIISDHYDLYWEEEKIINRTVSQVYNIQSLVWDLENMKVFFAEGEAPVHLRKYVEFDMGEIFSGKEGRTGRELPAFKFQSEGKQKSKEEYIASFIAAFDGKYDQAAASLEECMSHDFCPEAGFVGGVVHLKNGNYSHGLELFQKARAWIEKKCVEMDKDIFPPEYFEILIFEARALDLLGKKEEAEKAYASLALHPKLYDTNIQKIAARGGPYKKAKLDQILMPYSSFIPFN